LLASKRNICERKFRREEHINREVSERKLLDNILRKSLLEFKEVLIGSPFNLVTAANKNLGSSPFAPLTRGRKSIKELKE